MAKKNDDVMELPDPQPEAPAVVERTEEAPPLDETADLDDTDGLRAMRWVGGEAKVNVPGVGTFTRKDAPDSVAGDGPRTDTIRVPRHVGEPLVKAGIGFIWAGRSPKAWQAEDDKAANVAARNRKELRKQQR